MNTRLNSLVLLGIIGGGNARVLNTARYHWMGAVDPSANVGVLTRRTKGIICPKSSAEVCKTRQNSSGLPKDEEVGSALGLCSGDIARITKTHVSAGVRLSGEVAHDESPSAICMFIG